jgi:hypothetical protein
MKYLNTFESYNEDGDFEVVQSIVDIKTPFKITDELYDLYLDELKNSDASSIRDITPSGNFINGDSADYLRIEIDNRYLSNDEAKIILNNIFNSIKK